MASNSSGLLHADVAKTEQITADFFNKSVHTILESRIPSLKQNMRCCFRSYSSSSEGISLSEGLEEWRQSMANPLILDVLCISGQFHKKFPTICKTQSPITNGQMIERWILEHQDKRKIRRDFTIGDKVTFGNVGREINQGRFSEVSTIATDSFLSYKKTYRRTVILLRSLYCTARLLPAYRVYQRAKLSDSNCNFTVSYRVLLGNESIRTDEYLMKSYRFSPIETSCGTICVSVLYRPDSPILASAFSNVSDSLPPRIITDYVKSPSDTQRKFSYNSPSISVNGTTKPHSWNGVQYKALNSPKSRECPNKFSPSFSPCQAHVCDSYPTKPCQSRPIQIIFDEYRSSPPLSLSPPLLSSPLKEGCIYDRRSPQGSVPVNIPKPVVCGALRDFAAENSSPHKSYLPFVSPNSSRPDLLRRSTAEWQSSRRFTSLKPEGLQVASNVCPSRKLCKSTKEESGQSQRMRSSPSGTLFSRSSSRKSYLDETEDEDFSCPFAVYDDEVTDWTSRTNSSEERRSISGSLETLVQTSTPRRTQCAAVGLLVQLLNSAMPLHSESGDSCNPSKLQPISINNEGQRGGVYPLSTCPATQGLGRLAHRTTADALEELRRYKEIKEGLLSQGGTGVVPTNITTSRKQH